PPAPAGTASTTGHASTANRVRTRARMEAPRDGDPPSTPRTGSGFRRSGRAVLGEDAFDDLARGSRLRATEALSGPQAHAVWIVAPGGLGAQRTRRAVDLRVGHGRRRVL